MTDPLKGQTHALKPTEELMRELDAKRDNEPEPDDTPEGTDTQLNDEALGTGRNPLLAPADSMDWKEQTLFSAYSVLTYLELCAEDSSSQYGGDATDLGGQIRYGREKILECVRGAIREVAGGEDWIL